MTLVVNVTDVVDEKPVVTLHENAALMEERPNGSPVCNVFDVTDRDKNDMLVYGLMGKV